MAAKTGLQNLVKGKIWKNYNPFYDAQEPVVKYSDLNEVIIPSNQAIQAYQLEKIEKYQEIALAKKEKAHNTQRINQLFTSGEINTLTLESGEELKLNEALNNIVSNLDEIRNFQYWKGDRRKYLNELQNKIKNLNNILTTLQSQIKIDSIAFGNILDSLNSALDLCNIKSLNSKDLDMWLGKVNQLKGEVVEEIGTAWLKERIPELNSITTGALELRNIHSTKNWTPSISGASPGQFISDILALNITDVNLLEQIEITFRYGSKSSSKTVKLKEFLAFLEKKSGSSTHIAVDDNSYETLIGLSAINIQAKSGKNQLPWNKESKNTQVKIEEFIDEDGALVKAKHVFSLLVSLNYTEETKDWMQISSNKYDAIANYGLATALVKTLHLNEHGNQYLLTPNGFISYTERMRQLMKEETWIAKIKGGVTLDPNVLTNPRLITITGQKY